MQASCVHAPAITNGNAGLSHRHAVRRLGLSEDLPLVAARDRVKLEKVSAKCDLVRANCHDSSVGSRDKNETKLFLFSYNPLIILG